MFWWGGQLQEVCLFSKSREQQRQLIKKQSDRQPDRYTRLLSSRRVNVRTAWDEGGVCFSLLRSHLCKKDYDGCTCCLREKQIESVSEAELGIKGSPVCGGVGADSDTWGCDKKGSHIDSHLAHKHRNRHKLTESILDVFTVNPVIRLRWPHICLKRSTDKRPASFLIQSWAFWKHCRPDVLYSAETPLVWVTTYLMAHTTPLPSYGSIDTVDHSLL